MRTARVHATTQAFARKVDSAKRLVDRALSGAKAPQVSWSAGKDSTAMAHLVTVGCGARDVELFCQKDDLDFPGEEAYVRELAATWGATNLRVVRPTFSALEFVRKEARRGQHLGDDIHGRGAALSKAVFYPLVKQANDGHDCVMLGLRSDESGRRRILRERMGRLYWVKGDGLMRALPIADWSGIDVYAYLESVGVDPLSMYRCIGLMHTLEPWRLRKSWWLPAGNGVGHGQVTWLRRYYPSLYAVCRDLFDETSAMT